jgi:hypothetical protein
MLLQEKSSGHLIEVSDPKEVFDPFEKAFTGRLDYGEERSDPQKFSKEDVVFPSGEALPACWRDPHYRDK